MPSPNPGTRFKKIHAGIEVLGPSRCRRPITRQLRVQSPQIAYRKRPNLVTSTPIIMEAGATVDVSGNAPTPETIAL